MATLERQPYLVATKSAAYSVQTLLSAGEPSGDYRLGGTPDGLAAAVQADGTLKLWVAHAFASQTGGARAHGATGAYLSAWTLAHDPQNGEVSVVEGHDYPHVRWVRGVEGWERAPAGQAFARLNGLDLPRAGTFWETASQRGAQEGILLGGEEDANGGAAFAHVLEGAYAGSTWELPAFGSLRYENLLAQPVTSSKTTVIGISDRREGFLVLYQGEKQASGNPVERAGLAEGTLYVLADVPGEKDAFRWVALPEMSETPKSLQDTMLSDLKPRFFAHPKDGQWHPEETDTFYFTTQGQGRGATRTPSRLYRLNFSDPADPLAGGTLNVVLEEGRDPFTKLDSMTIDMAGDLWLQENPGKSLGLARVYRFQPETKALEEVLHANPHHFDPNGAGYITAIEEATGIIDLGSWLGAGHMLTAFHSHRGVDDPEREADRDARALFGWSLDEGKTLVEDGQLLLIRPSDK